MSNAARSTYYTTCTEHSKDCMNLALAARADPMRDSRNLLLVNLIYSDAAYRAIALFYSFSVGCGPVPVPWAEAKRQSSFLLARSRWSSVCFCTLPRQQLCSASNCVKIRHFSPLPTAGARLSRSTLSLCLHSLVRRVDYTYVCVELIQHCAIQSVVA